MGNNPIDVLLREHGLEPLPGAGREGLYVAPFDEHAWEVATATFKNAIGNASDQAAIAELMEQAIRLYVELVGQNTRAPAEEPRRCA